MVQVQVLHANAKLIELQPSLSRVVKHCAGVFCCASASWHVHGCVPPVNSADIVNKQQSQVQPGLCGGVLQSGANANLQGWRCSGPYIVILEQRLIVKQLLGS